MKCKFLLAFFLALPGLATGQMSVESPMVRALRDGTANAPLPESQLAQSIAQRIKAKTGSQGDVTVEAVRIERFVSQPACGRVAYGFFQQSSKTFWGQFGGQLNVCDDGTAPLRQCKGSLVPADMQCKDGTMPRDTPEIEASIKKAIIGGSLTAEQFNARHAAELKKQGAKK
jgi:hypothetical protein